MVVRTWLAVALALLAARPPAHGASPRGEAALEMLLVSLDLEKRGRADDIEELDRVTTRLARSESAAASARGRLVSMLKDGDGDIGAIESAEESIAEAEARVRAAEERRRALSARIAERLRRIAALGDEIAKRRAGLKGPSDPVTGRWAVVINPGPRRGVYRLVLDGTLVSGEFNLDGGFHGSLRGTYVGEKVTIQRIDSERGLDATFVGRVNPAVKRITGTWDATQIAPVTGPTAGEWVATLLPEKEDE